ncbi:MAG: hypothetical protein AB7N91_18335 [Candidatus Tectimicrobiota bacterium]
MAQYTPADAPRRHVLTEPEDIRWWATVRGGIPARVSGYGTADAVGGLRIAFPDEAPEEDLELISWELWFETLATQRLAFVVEI